MTHAVALKGLHHAARRRAEHNRRGAVNLGGYLHYLLLDAVAVGIRKAKWRRRLPLDGVDHKTRQLLRAGTALGKRPVDGKPYAKTAAVRLDGCNLGIGVARKAVDGNNHSLPELADVAQMLVEILKPRLDGRHILFLDNGIVDAALHLQSLHRGYKNREARLQSRLAALNVVKLLRSEVGAEPCLGDHIVAARHRCLRRHDGVAAVGYVGKRSAVDKRRRMLDGLHKIRLHRCLQKHRDGALNAHILDRERLVVVGETQQYVADAALKVGEVGRQADNSHQL